MAATFHIFAFLTFLWTPCTSYKITFLLGFSWEKWLELQQAHIFHSINNGIVQYGASSHTPKYNCERISGSNFLLMSILIQLSLHLHLSPVAQQKNSLSITRLGCGQEWDSFNINPLKLNRVEYFSNILCIF